MPCQHYRDALIEAAASSAALQGDLRAHLVECVDCRTAFEQEQALFASIDVGLRVTASAEMPVSLLPRVRARLDEVDTRQRRWFQPLVFAAASIALAFAILLFARPPHSNPGIQAKQTPQIPVDEARAANTAHQSPGPGTQIVSANATNSQTRVRSTLLRPVASSQPEVLVPPDEREAFARFVAVLGERRELALALVTAPLQMNEVPSGLEPFQINGLEIKPLDGTELEQSGWAEQKQ